MLIWELRRMRKLPPISGYSPTSHRSRHGVESAFVQQRSHTRRCVAEPLAEQQALQARSARGNDKFMVLPSVTLYPRYVLLGGEPDGSFAEAGTLDRGIG